MEINVLPHASESAAVFAARDFRRAEKLLRIETRISALATAQERGDAFEVFAEAYLDPAVQAGSDEIILRSSDLDFPVTTDCARVREFLAASYHGVKLVFSTYQSAHVVAAGMQSGEARV